MCWGVFFFLRDQCRSMYDIYKEFLGGYRPHLCEKWMDVFPSLQAFPSKLQVVRAVWDLLLVFFSWKSSTPNQWRCAMSHVPSINTTKKTGSCKLMFSRAQRKQNSKLKEIHTWNGKMTTFILTLVPSFWSIVICRSSISPAFSSAKRPLKTGLNFHFSQWSRTKKDPPHASWSLPENNCQRVCPHAFTRIFSW